MELLLKRLVILFAFLNVVPALPTNRNVRVIGGKMAEPGQFPSSVAIQMIPLGRYYCSGTIISKSWVLTAGQCFVGTAAFPEDINILAGTNDLRTGGTTYNVSQFIVHPTYNSTNLIGDLALVKIDGEFEFSDFVQVAEISDVSVNETCTVAGWGQTENINVPAEMFYANVRSLSDDECDELSEDGINFVERGPGQVCTYGGIGVGICDGDAGDALMVEGKLVGMGSYSVEPCALWAPDVYTRVGYYLDWINENI